MSFRHVLGITRRLPRALLALALAALPPSQTMATQLALNLSTSEDPPYQLVIAGELVGTSIQALECIARRLDSSLDIHISAPLRARHQVQKQRSDGFFSSTPDPEMAAHAQLSAPLAVEKWYWYARDPAALGTPTSSQRIAALLGGNPLRWLERRGIAVQPKVNDQRQLIQVLIHGRADRVLSDERTMNQALDLSPGTQLHRRFARFTPVGVYFSHDFLNRHPGFLEAFNARIDGCAAPAPGLSTGERQHLDELAGQQVARWRMQGWLQEALLAGRDHPKAERQQLDRDWLSPDGTPGPEHQRLLEQPASRRLALIQQQLGPLFNELLLSGPDGALLAASQATSDFDQGDEAHFSEAIGLPDGQQRVGRIEYDGSTQSFQVKVSAPLYLPGRTEAAGVLSLGIDLETAFLSN